MAQALRERSVPDRERLAFIIAFFGAPAVALMLNVPPPADMPTEGILLDNAVIIALNIAGIQWCVRAYPAEKRQELADHLACLIIPVAVVVVCPLYLLPVIGLEFAMSDNPLRWKVSTPLGWVVLAVYFWRLRHYLAESVSRDESPIA